MDTNGSLPKYLSWILAGFVAWTTTAQSRPGGGYRIDDAQGKIEVSVFRGRAFGTSSRRCTTEGIPETDTARQEGVIIEMGGMQNFWVPKDAAPELPFAGSGQPFDFTFDQVPL